MPWLSAPPSRQNSYTATISSPPEATQSPRTTETLIPVTFVPAQIDGMCSTTAPHMAQPPLVLMRKQALVFLSNMSCLPDMATAFCTKATMREYMADALACRDLLLQLCLGATQMGMLLIMPSMLLIMPGIVTICMLSVWLAMMAAMAYPLNEGSQVSKVRPDGLGMRDAEAAAECWIYVNSMMTSHHAHLAHIQRLASTFRRPVTGVHNRTYGPIADVLHTLIHPLLPSTTTIPLTNQIRAALRSPEIKKVIIVTYGTGSLALNTALDTLHADLPMVCMAQLEIYTFGAASRYMQNPLFMLDELSRRDVALPVPQQGERSRSRSPMPHYTRPDGSIASPVKATLKSLGHRVEDMERVIPHIEHYAFAGDMLARCGVLDAVRGGTSKFAGRLFVLNEGDETVPVVAREVKRDYILATFLGKIRSVFDNLKGGIPTQPATTTILPTCGTFNEYMDALFHQTPTTPSCLDTIPIIDTSTAERREFIAQSTIAPIKATRSMSLGLSLHIPNYPSNNTSNYFSHRPSNNHTTNHISSNPFSAHTSATLSPSLSSFDFPPRSRKEKRNSWGTTATLGLDGVGKARQCAREAEGRTVRQLSRLWRFAGGKVPVGEGIPASNGVGVPSVGSPMMNGNNHGLMNAYGTDNGVEETKKRRERKGYNINGGYTTISSPVPAPDSLTQFGLNHDGASEIADGPKSETPPSIEIFKSFKVSMDAPTHEVLPAALKKYNISHPAEEYNLYLAYTEAGVNKERLLERDEKALIIFKDLDRAGIKPMFMLRRTNPLDKETALNTALNGQFTNGVQTNGVQTNGVNSNGVETNGGEKNGHIEAKNGVNGVPAPAGTPVPTTA